VTREGLVTVADFQQVVFDDFETPSGWTVHSADDAVQGSWEQGDPESTILFGVHAQPELPASGASCWITELAAGDFAASGDVDGGSTTLRSPILQLATVEEPHVSYARWWSNNLAAADDDTLQVDVSSDAGATWWPLESVERSGTAWQWVQFRIADHVTPTDETCFRFVASDLGRSSLVEAGVDAFEILGRGRSTSAEPPASPVRPEALTVRPNPFRSAASIRWTAARVGSVRITVYDLGGRLVRVLESGERPAGAGETAWDGRDAHGRPVASGVYAVRVQTADGTATRKVVRLR
jgi:hypothetical protein